ncbi:WG repeat-containing protein [Candidatus Gracilibacteria bacterium]|nr:WG repeat-containing protein [Candidatus Gracilibacteria bacterium]
MPSSLHLSSISSLKLLSGFIFVIFLSIFVIYLVGGFSQGGVSKDIYLSGSIYKVPTDKDILTHPNWKFRDQYDAVYEFSDGVAKVIKDKKEGFINKDGEIVIPLGRYKETRDQAKSQRIMGEKKDDLCVILDLEGTEITTFKCYGYPDFSEGLSSILIGGSDKGSIVVDINGNTIIGSGKYGYIGNFQDGLAPVGIEKKIGFVNKNGELIIPAIYNGNGSKTYFSGGLGVMNNDGKYGVINKNNDVIIPFDYDKITSFSDGYAFANKNNACGKINKEGIFTPFDYWCNILESYGNFAKANTAKKIRIINQYGEFIFTGEFQHIYFQNERIITKKINHKNENDVRTEIYDFNGNLIIEFQYLIQDYPGVWKLSDPESKKVYGYLYPDGYIKSVKQ